MNVVFDVEAAFALCAATLILMIVPGFWLYRGVMHGLRDRHPETWEALGRPTVVYYSSQEARRALQRWLSDGAADSLGDPEFAASVRRYRRYASAYSAVFTALWILFALIVGMRVLG